MRAGTEAVKSWAWQLGEQTALMLGRSQNGAMVRRPFRKDDKTEVFHRTTTET